MRAVLPALVLGTMVATASACDSLDRERGGVSSSTGPDRDDVSGGTAGRVMRFTPPAPTPADTFAVDVRLDAGRDATNEAHDDAGADTDAGADPQDSEFERAIVYDCTETLRCMGRPGNNIPACVVSVREAFRTASAQTRQVFMSSVRRCRPRHDCDYVDCASSKTP